MNKQETYEYFKNSNIDYEVVEHEKVFTIDEVDELNIPGKEKIAKNLFLRDDKKLNYYLVTLPAHKKADLKSLRKEIGSRRLSFAQNKDVENILNVTAGSVTPIAVINDVGNKVISVFDEELKNKAIGIHPMENSATVFISFEDLIKSIKDYQNRIIICKIK
ncbi:YbaK/proline--tRNA ligase associated domain protein [Anaerofustis stercorihominis DSM 17244]|uniref:YbaK/proline--tRNA ligase associated domain protein n=1 Tax=Anaerofustis stercorihominis DSM 17244 TaxID=445971 RepID=B1C5P2_9FIRM|nr:prolyl-tRNA synthetase associated domain-containing protein [Anaerofustis stercorihominis]EDS73606.1 YbaK/proline--tRNA ligase associated domain protein [Anaerofustis stercorihominis DSM 17244]